MLAARPQALEHHTTGSYNRCLLALHSLKRYCHISLHHLSVPPRTRWRAAAAHARARGLRRGGAATALSRECDGTRQDTDSWPNDFGRDVLEGILEHEDSGIPLARRKAEPFERLQQRVVAVTKAFAPYDWTKQM